MHEYKTTRGGGSRDDIDRSTPYTFSNITLHKKVVDCARYTVVISVAFIFEVYILHLHEVVVTMVRISQRTHTSWITATHPTRGIHCHPRYE